MKRIKAVIMFFLIFSSVSLAAFSFTKLNATEIEEQVLFEDNFESYSAGTFPSSGGWELWFDGEGAQHQVILQNVSASPTKSLKLLGVDFWAAFAARRFNSTSAVVGFEVAARVADVAGGSRDNARVAFTRKVSGSLSTEYAPVTFDDGGTIDSGGQVLQSYEADKWYKIKLVMDRSSNTYSVWVDGELKGENLIVTTTAGNTTANPTSQIEAFSVSQCYNGVTAYFDDIKIYSLADANPRLELVPAKGIAATTLVGSGFTPNSQISVTWNGTPIPTVPSPLLTDDYGNFTGIISVLDQVAGDSVVKAVDEMGNAATASFTATLGVPSQDHVVVPDDYPTIQEAINHVNEGATITVKAGTYYESVTINKRLNLTGVGFPVIDGNGSPRTVLIVADGVVFQGFEVTNAGGTPDEPFGGGIELNNVRECVIVGNNFYSNSQNGISLTNSNHNTIKDNACMNNTDGIRLWSRSPLTSSNNLIINNTCFGNRRYGIEFWSYVYETTTTNNNIITQNNCSENRNGGIYIGKSLNSVVSENTFANNEKGIYLDGLNMDTRNITVTNNLILNSRWGFYLSGTGLKQILIAGNTVKDNEIGVYSKNLYDNEFYHNNFIQNEKQTWIGNASENSWDNGFEGNFWSNYNGTDDDEDGIGDVPYIIDENNQDNYPLMNPWSPSPFSSNQLIIVSVPSGVTFTVDNTTYTTPWSMTYKENTLISLTMPETQSIENNNYVWWQWRDGNTNRTRTITLKKSLILTATYTPEATSLKIPLLSPENKTYATTDIPLEFNVNETFVEGHYILDDQSNVTISGNTTLTGLTEGPHNIIVYLQESQGIFVASNVVYFTVDTTPPTIIDVKELRIEVNGTDMGTQVNATVTDAVSGVEWVALNYTDGNGNWTLSEMSPLEDNIWNGTIPAFPHGINVTYVIIARDKAQNTITSEDLLGYANEYEVLSEFPALLFLPIFLAATLIAVIINRRRLKTGNSNC